MTDLDLLEEAVAEIEREEAEEKREVEQFKERYDVLVDCAIDEINDEILKFKLNETKRTGRFMLLRDGEYFVYRKGVLSVHRHLGGEEFSLLRVERNHDGSKSMMNVILKPLDPYVEYSQLVLPYDKSLSLLSEEFGKVIARYLSETMSSIEKDVLGLRQEMEESYRQRELRLSGVANSETYTAVASW